MNLHSIVSMHTQYEHDTINMYMDLPLLTICSLQRYILRMTSLSLRRSSIDLSAKLTSGCFGVGVDDARRDSASNRSLRDTMSLGVTGGGMTPLRGDPKSLMCDDIIDSSSSLS